MQLKSVSWYNAYIIGKIGARTITEPFNILHSSFCDSGVRSILPAPRQFH